MATGPWLPRYTHAFSTAWVGRSYPRAVLVKGGHLLDGRATDVLVTRRGVHVIPGEWIDTPHTHGTGCTYASAIATHLARGRRLREAVTLAKAYVTEAIRGGFPVGHGAHGAGRPRGVGPAAAPQGTRGE